MSQSTVPPSVIPLAVALLANVPAAAPETSEQPERTEPVAPSRERELRAADVLKRILGEAPTPTGITVHAKAWRPKPYVEVYLHRDVDLARLLAYQQMYGGTIAYEKHANGNVCIQLSTEVDGVGVQTWTLLTPDQVPASQVPAGAQPTVAL